MRRCRLLQHFVLWGITDLIPLSVTAAPRSGVWLSKSSNVQWVEAELNALFKTQQRIPRASKDVIQLELKRSDNNVLHLSCFWPIAGAGASGA
jgi:hypothetical protein